MKKLNRIIKIDSYDAVSFFNGLVFFAPVSLLVRTQAGVSQSMFFLLQALLSAITFLGEIPTGFLTDRIGYKRSLVLSQGLLLLARFLLFVGFICKSSTLFAVEVIVEGLSYCFVSGTDSAYVYEVYGTKNYLSKMAHASNCGTAGFFISTVGYVVIYHVFGIEGLLLSTIATGMAAAFFSFKLKKEPSKVIGQKEILNTTAEQIKNRQSNHKNMENCHPLKQLFSTMKHPKALLFAVTLSVFQVSWLLINFFYAGKLEKCGISVEWMSAVILGYSAVEMLAEPIIRKLGNAFSKKMGICLWSCQWYRIPSFWICFSQNFSSSPHVNTTAFAEITRVFCDGARECISGHAWCRYTESSGVIHSEHGGQYYGDTNTICIGSADGSRNRMVFLWSRYFINYCNALLKRYKLS